MGRDPNWHFGRIVPNWTKDPTLDARIPPRSPAQLLMNGYTEFATHDVDELESHETDQWESTFRQLSSGRLAFQTRSADLDGIRLNWNSFGQSLKVTDLRTAEGFSMGLPLDLVKPGVVECRDARVGDALLFYPGREVSYLIPTSSRSLMIDVDFSTLAWHPGHPIELAMMTPSPESVQELTRYCLKATRLIRLNTLQPSKHHAVIVKELRQGIVRRLEPVLRPWTRNDTTHPDKCHSSRQRFHSLQRAERFLREWPDSTPPSIDRTAAELEVSKRTLYREFQRWNDVSPYRFYLIERLHRFRTELIIEGHDHGGSVAEAARRSGFKHLSRATGSYRELFGELPSQTIQRRRESGGNSSSAPPPSD